MRASPAIGESRKKDDRLDAQTLARLARIDPELLYRVKPRSAQDALRTTISVFWTFSIPRFWRFHAKTRLFHIHRQ